MKIVFYSIKLISAIFLILSLFQATLLAQENILKIDTQATPEPLPNASNLSQKLNEINTRIEEIQKNTTNNFTIPSSDITDKLNQLRLILQQQAEVLEESKQSNQQTADNLIKIQNLTSKDIQKSLPKSFEESENLRNQIISTKESKQKITEKLKNLRALIEQSKSNLEEHKKELRVKNESLPKDLQEQSSNSQNEELAIEIEQENINLLRLEVELEKANLKKNQSAYKILKSRLETASEISLLSRTDFQRKLSQLEEVEQSLKLEQEQNKDDLNYADKLLVDSKEKLDSSSENSPIEIERLEIANSIKSSTQTRIRINTERLQRISSTRELWETRYNNRYKNIENDLIIPQREKATVTIERLKREKNLVLSELDETRKKTSLLETNLDNAEANKKQKVWYKDYKIALTKLENSYNQNLSDLDNTINLYENFLLESKDQVANASWKHITQEISNSVVNIWEYELFTSGDYPVTIGKLIFGVILLLLGYFASDLFSRKIITKLLVRFNMTQGAIAAIQSLTFYLLLITFAVLALRIVNVPLTAFTVIGGALAIGVGFGSQNVMNNFISGLILLIEQPIRVGDMIEVDTFTGIVKKIGARSTIVRTGNNIEIVVPNSSFLEKNVVNWTRNNSQARLHIRLGVEYDSDVDFVSETLLKAIENNQLILSSPKPFVLLTEFGESSLNFELNFWVNVRSSTEKNSIESEIRYDIYKIFNENKIKFAFPHSNIHTSKPIEFKLIGNKNV